MQTKIHKNTFREICGYVSILMFVLLFTGTSTGAVYENAQQLAVAAVDAQRDLHLDVMQGLDVRQVAAERQPGDADGSHAEQC